MGFASFFIMEKTLRVLGSDDPSSGHSHSHSHSHAPPTNSANSSAVDKSSKEGLRSRTVETADKSINEDLSKESADAAPSSGSQVSKLSAYLNLFGDFVHNM